MIGCFLVWASKVSVWPNLVLLLDSTVLLCPLRVQTKCTSAHSQAIEQRMFLLSVSFKRVLLPRHHKTLEGWLVGWCLAMSSSLTTIPQSGWFLHWNCPGRQTLLLSWRFHWSVVHPELLVLVGFVESWQGWILSVVLSLTLENRSWSSQTNLPRIWTVRADQVTGRDHSWTDQGWSCGGCS